MILMQLQSIILLLAVTSCCLVWGEATDNEDLLAINRNSPADAKVYFIQPVDGQVYKSGEPIVVQFGLRGMGVAPAGVAMSWTGHHHILINQ